MTSPADDQAARATRRMLDAENREIIALQQVDDQAATIAALAARVAAVRALADRSERETGSVFPGYVDTDEIRAALEVVRQDDTESTRTTSGPAEALAQAAVAWAEVMRHEEVTPDDHTLTAAVDAYLAASEVAPKHRAGVSVGPPDAPAPMVENTTMCGWSDDGRHRWGLGRDKNECADCDAPKWIVGPAEAPAPAQPSADSRWGLPWGSGGHGNAAPVGPAGAAEPAQPEWAILNPPTGMMAELREELRIEREIAAEAGAPEPSDWICDTCGSRRGEHEGKDHAFFIFQGNGPAGSVTITPPEPGYQRIADAIQQLCEESAEVQIQLRPTKAGVTEWIGDQYLRLAQILDRAGLIDWTALQDSPLPKETQQ